MPITFLVHPDFETSAKFLDWKRLGKQRVEAVNVLESLFFNENDFWTKSAIGKTWRGHEWWLAQYALAVCDEWIARGGVDNIKPRVQAVLNGLKETPRPWFCLDDRFMSSHRGNLLRKDPEFYGKFGWTDSPDLPYFWPHEESPLPGRTLEERLP